MTGAPAGGYITVAELGKELGIGIPGTMRLAEAVGLRITRGAAQLSPAHVARMRRAHAAKMAAFERHQARPDRQPGLTHSGARLPRLVVLAAGTGFCSCCGLHVGIGQPLTDGRCALCEDHAETPDETADDRLERLADHEARLKVGYRERHAAAERFREDVRRAYGSRDRWRAALAEVILAHEERGTGCACGARQFPCATVQKLDRVNRGIAREVEKLGTLTDDELQDELYGSKPEE